MSLQIIALTLSAVLVVAAVLRRRNRGSSSPLPPGPPRLPIVGNAFNEFTPRPWEVYMAWAKQYNSDIIHLDMAGASIIVLDSYEACVELLDRRSGLYSSRPRMAMFQLMGYTEWNTILMPYGNKWRVHRRLSHQALHEEATKDFRPNQVRMAHRMLKNVRKDPEDFAKLLRLMVSQVILSSFYGLDSDTTDHPYLQLAEAFLESSEEPSLPGNFLVEAFPIMEKIPQWFPGARFQRQAKIWRGMAYNYIDTMISETEKKMEAGNAPYSFVAHNLSQIEHEPSTQAYRERREVIRNVAGVIYGAGSDTTYGSLLTFVHAAVRYPEIQRKAQAELDRVLGPGQLPSFEQMDEGTLPYCTAVAKEVVRWGAVAPLLIPHFVETEDEYKGYRIPANSTVFANSWSILRDEEAYPEADKFKPERYLKEDGTLNPDVRDPILIAFGFGRRTCPGRHFAFAAIWIAVSSMLRTFDISPEVDEQGRPVELVIEKKHGLTSFPNPFKCQIRPRPTTEREIFAALEHEDAF